MPTGERNEKKYYETFAPFENKASQFFINFNEHLGNIKIIHNPFKSGTLKFIR